MKLYLTPKTLKKIIKLLILFILLCILIYFSNTLNVNATTTSSGTSNEFNITFPVQAYWYDNINGSLTNSGYYLDTYPITSTNDFLYLSRPNSSINTNPNGSGAVISLPISFATNSKYVMYFYFLDDNSSNMRIPATNQIFRTCGAYSCSTPGDLITSYSSSALTSSTTYGNNAYIKALRYTFTTGSSTSNNNWLQFSFTTTNSTTWSSLTPRGFIGYTLYNITDASSNDIITEIEKNQNTLDTIQQQQTQTDSLITNQGEQTREEITNQGEETREEIKDATTTCGEYSKSFSYSSLPNRNKIINSTGQLEEYNGFNLSDYISITGGYSYQITWNYTTSSPSNYLISIYDKSKNFISSFNYANSKTLNLSNYEGSMYIRIQLFNSRPDLTIYNSNVCMKDTDILDNSISDGFSNLNDSITDSSDPNLAVGDVAGWLPPGPVDSVLNLPLTILNSLISNLSNRTCSAVDVPLPYIDKSIQLPCLSTIFEKTGFTNVLNTISIPFAIFIYINTLIKLYGWVDKTLQFREEHWNDVDQWGGI